MWGKFVTCLVRRQVTTLPHIVFTEPCNHERRPPTLPGRRRPRRFLADSQELGAGRASGLIVLGHSTFDLVLLDYILQDTTGLELLQTLSQEGIAAPVLMVTAQGNEKV